MRLVVLDFETFYSKEYSLSKMTTEEYIRDPRFEVIGVSAQVDDSSPSWCTGHVLKVKAFLDSLQLEDAVVVAHNAMFDMAVLNWVFQIRPKRIVDTLSMSRALHSVETGHGLAALAEYYQLGTKGVEVLNAIGKRRDDFSELELAEYGRYCMNDVKLTHALLKKLIVGFPVVELKLIDLTIRMFTEPMVVLNASVLEANLKNVQAQKQGLLATAIISKENLMCNAGLAKALSQFGAVAPTKISPTTGKTVYAFAKTDEEFTALLDYPHILVQAIVAARLGVKSTIEETRTERLIGISKRGLMPIPLRYYAAHTGRWGGDDKVNMQNLPRNSVLKYALEAPEGYVFVDCDSAQIEARTLAWLAEQDDLVEAFAQGKDVYTIMAAVLFAKTQAEVSKAERFVGKTTILGAGYGMGATKFAMQLKPAGTTMTDELALEIIKTYRSTYPRIPQLWKQAKEALQAMIEDRTAPLGREGVLVVEGKKGIRLPNGLYLKYPHLRWYDNKETGEREMVYDTKKGKSIVRTRIYGGKLVENICQALARIVVGEQLVRVARKFRVVMTVHDAIGCLVPEGQEVTGLEYVEICMRIRPTWAPDLPLNCEGGYGKSYGDC